GETGLVFVCPVRGELSSHLEPPRHGAWRIAWLARRTQTTPVQTTAGAARRKGSLIALVEGDELASPPLSRQRVQRAVRLGHRRTLGPFSPLTRSIRFGTFANRQKAERRR